MVVKDENKIWREVIIMYYFPLVLGARPIETLRSVQINSTPLKPKITHLETTQQFPS